MQTIWNYLESVLIAGCLVFIGVGALWAWGAWNNVEVSHERVLFVPSDTMACPDGRICQSTRPVSPEVEHDTTGEAWTPITTGVDLHSKALSTLAELDRHVKAQALTIEQARAEYAAFKAARKP